MSGNDAMAWWYRRIDYERRTPVAADLKLDQMRALLRALDEPQRRVRVVHIAGSKGKGSTAAMLAEILRSAGYRTGLFTSPHLCDVTERMRVDGEPISQDELIALLAEIRDAVPPGVEPTFFEVATAAGWLHFVRRRVDVAVVEVGLGGRFDSTNVCAPLLSVITSISYDHTKILGDTLAKIAFEKAGILKPGVPAVSGATAPEAAAVIEQMASDRGCPLLRLGREVNAEYMPGHVDDGPPRVTVRTPLREWRGLELGLLGAHQAANAAVAVTCVEELQKLGLSIDERHVAAGLAGVRWPARLEVLGRRPWVVLDCAHNTASVEALVETLRDSFPPGRRWLILAASSDKDVPGMLRLIAPHFDHFLLTRYAQNQRAVMPEQLMEWLKDVRDVPVEIHATAPAAWAAAKSRAAEGDMIVVTGSVFLAGELRPLMVSHDLQRASRCP